MILISENSCSKLSRTSEDSRDELTENSPRTRGGGGGGVLRFGSDGGCAAEAAKPVPIFKGHFGGKGYPLLGVFIQENDVFVYFSDEMGENI